MINLPSRLHHHLILKKLPILKDFIASVVSPAQFEWYKQFVRDRARTVDDNEFKVDFDLLILHLEYSRRDNALRILKDFEKDVEYKNFPATDQNPDGGRPKENIRLTLNAAQRFCLLSRTNKGKETAKTVIKLLECMADYDILSTHMGTRTFKHQTVVEVFSKYPVLYLANVYFIDEDGTAKTLKKIGITNDLTSRQETLPHDMKATCFFTHAFHCIRNHALEKEILSFPSVASRLYTRSINGHISKETVELDAEFTEVDLINVIKDKLPEFNVSSEDQRLERDKIELEKQKVDLLNQKIRLVEQCVKSGMSKAEAEESIENDRLFADNVTVGTMPISLFAINSRKNSRKYKIQRIDPTDLTTPVAIYESALDATRLVPGASKSRILAAIKDHTLYMGSRWWTVNHTDDQTIVHDLPPTHIVKPSPRGLVAKLTKDGTVIKQVFANQREAMREAQLTSTGAISIAIKKGTLSYGHRYKLWDDCDEELKTAYIQVHGEPEIPKHTGTKIQRLHPLTKVVLETYETMEFVVKTFQVSRQNLKNAIKNEKIVKGWLWQLESQT